MPVDVVVSFLNFIAQVRPAVVYRIYPNRTACRSIIWEAIWVPVYLSMPLYLSTAVLFFRMNIWPCLCFHDKGYLLGGLEKTHDRATSYCVVT